MTIFAGTAMNMHFVRIYSSKKSSTGGIAENKCSYRKTKAGGKTGID